MSLAPAQWVSPSAVATDFALFEAPIRTESRGFGCFSMQNIFHLLKSFLSRKPIPRASASRMDSRPNRQFHHSLIFTVPLTSSSMLIGSLSLR